MCQKDNKEKLMAVTKDSLQSLDGARQLRSKMHNDNFRDATNKLEIFLRTLLNHYYGIRTVDLITRVKQRSNY